MLFDAPVKVLAKEHDKADSTSVQKHNECWPNVRKRKHKVRTTDAFLNSGRFFEKASKFISVHFYLLKNYKLSAVPDTLRRHQKLASKPGLCQYLPQPIDAP
jgi:hypothetical protein